MSKERIFYKEAWIVKDSSTGEDLYFATEGPDENSPILSGNFLTFDQVKYYLRNSVNRRFGGFFISRRISSDWDGIGEFHIRRNILDERPVHEGYFSSMEDVKSYIKDLPRSEKEGLELETKPTNPKDIIGSSKLPLHLFPPTARAYGAIAFSEGALKYGRNNFREAGVKASIYYDALGRHMDAWFEGQDCDPVTKVPHLANAIACVAILIEAVELGNLQDDRNFPGGYFDCKEKMSPILAHLKELFKRETPRHFLIGDANEKKET